MHLPPNAHVAVVDGTKFMLFRNAGDAQTVDLRSAKMPARDDGAAPNAGPGDSPRQNAEAGHSAGVAATLNHAVLTNAISKLFVIADPATLGEMRHHFHKELEAALIGDLAKTLTGHSVDDIAKSIAAA